MTSLDPGDAGEFWLDLLGAIDQATGLPVAPLDLEALESVGPVALHPDTVDKTLRAAQQQAKAVRLSAEKAPAGSRRQAPRGMITCVAVVSLVTAGMFAVWEGRYSTQALPYEQAVAVIGEEDTSVNRCINAHTKIYFTIKYLTEQLNALGYSEPILEPSIRRVILRAQEQAALALSGTWHADYPIQPPKGDVLRALGLVSDLRLAIADRAGALEDLDRSLKAGIHALAWVAYGERFRHTEAGSTAHLLLQRLVVLRRPR